MTIKVLIAVLWTPIDVTILGAFEDKWDANDAIERSSKAFLAKHPEYSKTDIHGDCDRVEVGSTSWSWQVFDRDAAKADWYMEEQS